MTKVTLTLLSSLSFFFPLQAQESSPPDRAQVEATVERLRTTLGEDSIEASLELLLEAREIPHEDIVASIESR